MAKITQIVLSCDNTWDMVIDIRELNTLTLHIPLVLEVQGTKLGAELFKMTVRKNGNISCVLRGKSSEGSSCTTRSDSLPQSLTLALVLGAMIFGNGKHKGVDAEETCHGAVKRKEWEPYAAMKALHYFR